MKDLEGSKTLEGWAEKNVKGDTVYASVDYRVLSVENIHATPLERQKQRERFVQYLVVETAGKTYDLQIFKEAKAEYEAQKEKELIKLQREMTTVEKTLIKQHLPEKVTAYLSHKTRSELSWIANGRGSFDGDVEELCLDPIVAQFRGTVKTLMKSMAGILVNQTYLGQVMGYATGLFDFVSGYLPNVS